MSVSAPELDRKIGRTLGGQYRLVRVIGRGGTGAVFEAEVLGSNARCAVKMLHAEWATEPSVAGRFAREARAASSIQNEHIVTVIGGGTDDGCPYLAMELVQGEDLGTRLRREGRIPLGDALHVAAQVLRGLAAAHAAGIVHRDLKPDNVLLGERAGDTNFATIVDFGMSKIEKPRSGTAPLPLTRQGVIVGTPFYMAPEQVRSLPDVDGRADLYALGAILFECLSGRPPHVGESYEQVLVAMCLNDAPDLRKVAPEVPAEVAAFVARALARERAERFASAEEMLEALRELAPEDRAAWAPMGEEVRANARRARMRVVGAAAIALIAGAGAMIAWLAAQRAPQNGGVAPPGAQSGDVARSRSGSSVATAPAKSAPLDNR
jgi:serine/threonine-protein kinase